MESLQKNCVELGFQGEEENLVFVGIGSYKTKRGSDVPGIITVWMNTEETHDFVEVRTQEQFDALVQTLLEQGKIAGFTIQEKNND